MKASQKAIDWLDENAQDGGFLFSNQYPEGEAMYLAGGVRGDTYWPEAYAILKSWKSLEWVVGEGSVVEECSYDVPLSDERLQEFLDAYGFKPIATRETLTIPIDEVRVGDELVNVGVVIHLGVYGTGLRATCDEETLTTNTRTHLVTVLREVDPDDELIELLVKEGFGEWYTTNVSSRETYRQQMKAALAKAREVGLL